MSRIFDYYQAVYQSEYENLLREAPVDDYVAKLAGEGIKDSPGHFSQNKKSAEVGKDRLRAERGDKKAASRVKKAERNARFSQNVDKASKALDEFGDNVKTPEGRAKIKAGVQRRVNKGVDNVKKSVSSGFDNAKKGISSGADTVKRGISSGADSVKKGVSSGFEASKGFAAKNPKMVKGGAVLAGAGLIAGGAGYMMSKKKKEKEQSSV